MLTTGQLATFFPDLNDERVETALALVHSRFSTNTFPSWPLAHPYRLIAHNGEINTIKGNRNWMRAREALLATGVFGGDLRRLLPVCTEGMSDSASFDEVLELLHLAGRTLPHAVLMMIPEAWENHEGMDPARRAFYEYHATLMEPWDGPAAVTFTDGTVIGAVLDRNGLRPARWWRTDDDLVVLASEAGVLDVDPARVVAKGRLQPGRMFLVDTAARRLVTDDEIKGELAAANPYPDWLHAGSLHLDDLPARDRVLPRHDDVVRRQQVFGYTEEELRVLLEPMARTGAEPTGSMGTDTPVAVLSERPRLLFDYFSQLFAQVTNPPLDAIREELVTSLQSTIGPDTNLLSESPAACRKVVLPFPVLDNDELAKLVHIAADGDLPGLAGSVVSGLYDVDGGGEALAAAVERVRAEVVAAIEAGTRIVVLSDRGGDDRTAPVPSLLLVAAVHHHLVRTRLRTKVGLVVESGDCREVHHMALLLGYGAAAVNPYLAFETVEDLVRVGRLSDLDRGTRDREPGHGAGQGRAEGDVQDGHLDGGVVHRRPGLRGARASASRWWTTTSPAPRPGSAASGWTCSRRRSPPGTAPRTPATPPSARTAASRSAGSTPGGARARCTCSTRRRSSCCSTPPGPAATTCTAATRPRWTSCPGGPPPCGGCSSCAGASARRCRSTRSSRSPRSSSASPPAPCRTGRSRRRRTRRWPWR